MVLYSACRLLRGVLSSADREIALHAGLAMPRNRAVEDVLARRETRELQVLRAVGEGLDLADHVAVAGRDRDAVRNRRGIVIRDCQAPRRRLEAVGLEN